MISRLATSKISIFLLFSVAEEAGLSLTFLMSIISRLVTSKISIFFLFSVAEEAGLSLTLLETWRQVVLRWGPLISSLEIISLIDRIIVFLVLQVFLSSVSS